MGAGEQPPRQPGDDLEPVNGRISKHELLNVDRVAQPGDAVDQFGCVRRRASDDGDLHARTRPRPRTEARTRSSAESSAPWSTGLPVARVNAIGVSNGDTARSS